MDIVERLKQARDVWVKCEGTMISLNQDEIHELVEYIEKLTKNWNELKSFIERNCFYDDDTITYEDLMNKIFELEE